MGVARRWVFPIIRIVIFVAIAAALVKLAFFTGATDGGADPTLPTGQITDPEVAVSIGTIRNDVELDATVSADAAVSAKATLAGEVQKVLVAPGQAVAADTPVATLKSETPNADGTGVIVKRATVLAGAAGTVSAVPVIVGQTVSVGDELAKVAPPTFHVSGTMAPAQQYRLLSRPSEAEVTITGGPAPFVCGGLSISTPLAGSGDGSGGEGSTVTTTVTCAVPADVVVFAGLAAKMTIAGGIAENVLTVPVTAVEGTTGAGRVYVADPAGGEPTPKDVTLGINDGENVEITGGVAEGDLVLQFVPGADQVDPGMGFPVGVGG